jgi:hypothetical protein
MAEVTTPKNAKRNNKPRRTSSGDEEDVLKSISSKASVLLHPQVTLTCYIPTNSVGAVIGRRGSTILQIQRHAQSVENSNTNNGPVRVSIVGHDEDDVPYTYSELDWTSPHWTPVVVRGGPCAALAAGQRLLDIVGELDEVVLDLPLSRQKHASLIGKRGLVLANLSADTSVRIMVPRRDVRHDVVQLEGDLQNVRKCLEKVLQLCETKPPPTTLTLAQLPSQTKLRNVSRKTETTIRKKKADNDSEMWQLSISGATAEHIASAVQMLERWQEEQPVTGESPPRRNNNNANCNTAGRGRGRSHRNNNNKGGKNNSKNKQASPAAESTPPTN